MKIMATRLKFDELNVVGNSRIKKSNKPMPLPYRDYFGAMHITPKQMRSRMELAEGIEDVMLYVFAYWAIAASAEIPIDEVRQDAKDKMRLLLGKHTKMDSYLEKHINDVIDEVIDTTAKHTKDDESDYWLSSDRAMLIAENEANSFENYVDYREAATGGRVKKKWVTENDDKVRVSHELAEGQTVDIDGLFLVGDSLMRFPMDTMYDPDPREIINCRCACIYE